MQPQVNVLYRSIFNDGGAGVLAIFAYTPKQNHANFESAANEAVAYLSARPYVTEVIGVCKVGSGYLLRPVTTEPPIPPPPPYRINFTRTLTTL